MNELSERPAPVAAAPQLSHLSARGEVHMVEVGDRPASDRRALAEGFIAMAPEVLALVLEGRAGKGDVLAVARVAAIQAAKRTWELIPLCHPIGLTGLEVVIEPAADGSGLRMQVSARTTGSTGVEMEALTAVSVGLLTLYDMVKSADAAMTIGPVRLLRKDGGRHGLWQRDGVGHGDGEGPGAASAAQVAGSSSAAAPAPNTDHG